MTPESEELVARLDDLILDQLLHLGRPGAELQMAARQVRQAVLDSGLLVSAAHTQATLAGLEETVEVNKTMADAVLFRVAGECRAAVLLKIANALPNDRSGS